MELELGNALKALSTARCLLEIPECSRIYAFLANIYAAESLCLLNQPKEAAEHLWIYLSGGTNVDLPYTKEDCEQWRVEKIADFPGFRLPTAKNSSVDQSQDTAFLKPEEARGTLYANLAALLAVKGDLEWAHCYAIQALSTVPNSAEAALTAVYVDIITGKSQKALTKLKQCSRVRFLPSSSTLKGFC